MCKLTQEELAQPLEVFETETFINLKVANLRYRALVKQRMNAQIAATVQRDQLLQALRMRIEGRTLGAACPYEKLLFEKAGVTVPVPCI